MEPYSNGSRGAAATETSCTYHFRKKYNDWARRYTLGNRAHYGACDAFVFFLPSAKLTITAHTIHGPHPRPFRNCCQPDRRRRGCGEACLGGEGDAGELARCRLDAHQDQRG